MSQSLTGHLERIERNNPYYFFRANQQQVGTKIYSITQCILSVNECDWHILAGNDERINTHCLSQWNQGIDIKIHFNCHLLCLKHLLPMNPVTHHRCHCTVVRNHNSSFNHLNILCFIEPSYNVTLDSNSTFRGGYASTELKLNNCNQF